MKRPNSPPDLVPRSNARNHPSHQSCIHALVIPSIKCGHRKGHFEDFKHSTKEALGTNFWITLSNKILSHSERPQGTSLYVIRLCPFSPPQMLVSILSAQDATVQVPHSDPLHLLFLHP